MGVCSLALFGMILSPTLMEFLSSLIRLLTEGNTFGKHFVFLGFFIFVGLLKLGLGNKDIPFISMLSINRVKTALFALIAIGFAFNIIANLLIFQEYGAPINGYVAHVANCGISTCWEATYIQHSHSLKPAINFIDQKLHLNLGSMVDTGRPMSEIEPNVDAVSIIALAILALIFTISIILAIKEENYANLLILQLASIVSIISVLDGGLFTVAGINAIVLLALYWGNGEKTDMDWKFYAFLLAYVYFIGAIVPKLVGTNLVFLSYFALAGILISIFILYKSNLPKFPKFLAYASIFLLIFSAWHLHSLFNYVYNGENAGPSGKAIIYGFPDDLATDNALSNFNAPKLSSFYRYGWYAAVVPSKELAVNGLVKSLKPSVSPKGYFLGEADSQEDREGLVTVILRGNAAPVEISTVSFRAIGYAICEKRCVIRGTTSLYANHLALEISSFLYSKGYDAVVITPVMWDYGKVN